LSTWEELQQGKFLPNDVQAYFGINHPPLSFSRIHGYDRTNYNNRTTPEDTGKVVGTFSGWTASDIIMSTSNAARLVWNIYGPNSTYLSKESQARMIPNSKEYFYGFATFNMTGWFNSKNEKPVITYGHLGATYGYQSIVTYFPSIQTVITIASNLETDYQVHPRDTLCLAYHRIKSHILNENIQKCQYVSK